MSKHINISKAQIGQLHREASLFGDLRMSAICALALGGVDALEGADPGTDFDILFQECLAVPERDDEEWARAQCAAAIYEARAQEAA